MTTIDAKATCSRLQTIETRFHGPTGHNSARISATTHGGTRIYISREDCDDMEECHALACERLMKQLNWEGHMVGGNTKKGMCWVFMP